MNAKRASSCLVEVVTTWGDTVLSVRHLSAGERFVVDADERDSSSESRSNLNSWALAGVSLDGRCWVELPPDALYAVESTERAEPSADGDPEAPVFDRATKRGEAFELVEGVRVRCMLGSRVFAVRMVRDERASLARVTDPAWRLAFATAVAIVGSTFASLESNHRVFDSELVARPRDAQEARLRALIQRAHRDDSNREPPQREDPPRSAARVATRRSPESVLIGDRLWISQFGWHRGDPLRGGIFAMPLYYDEEGFAGLSSNAQGMLTPTVESFYDVLAFGDWHWGVGGVEHIAPGGRRARIAVRIESRTEDALSRARVLAAQRLEPQLRRCYDRALESLGPHSGSLMVLLEYGASREVIGAQVYQSRTDDLHLDTCTLRAVRTHLARAERAGARERITVTFGLAPSGDHFASNDE